MNAVAISRLDDDEVGLGDRLRVQHEGVGIAAEIAGEDDTPAGPFDIGCRGAEDVSGKAKGDPRAARQFGGFGELDRAKGLDRALRVAYAIERQGRLVPRGADAVEAIGVLLVEIAAILENDLRHLARPPGRGDSTPQTAPHPDGP